METIKGIFYMLLVFLPVLAVMQLEKAGVSFWLLLSLLAVAVVAGLKIAQALDKHEAQSKNNY